MVRCKKCKKPKYNVLIGLSGGVDSSMCLHYAIEQGLKPLCFSVDNSFNTKESDENIMRLVETLKVPFYRYNLNQDKFKEVYKTLIKSGIKNLESLTDHVLMAISYEMARKYGIKYIISGGNIVTEGCMPEHFGHNARDLTLLKSIYKKYSGRKLTGLPVISLLGYIWNRFVLGIKNVYLLDYYEYDRAKAIKLLSEKYGYKNYGDKHCESRLTKWFQGCYLPQKFKLDKRIPHYSSMIHSGQMTRNEALEKLKESFEYDNIDWGIDWKNTDINDVSSFKNSEYWWNLFSKFYAKCKF